jgi:hypothetical protein
MTKTIKVGMLVEFESSYEPGTPRETRRGRAIHVGSAMFPSNPVVMTEVGRIETLAKNLRVIEEG